MTKLNLYSTRNDRIEWVQAQIAGLFDLEHNTDLYDTPGKWEKIIDCAMGAARDYDAQSISSDTSEHVRTALEKLEWSHLLDELNRPFSSIGRTIFNRNMASLIVDAADSVDSQLAAAGTGRKGALAGGSSAVKILVALGLIALFLLIVAVGIFH